MRISNERRRDTEQRVRAAARAMLAGEIPAGGKCDITTLARQAGISRATLYRSYPHLKAEFEDQLARRQASGCAPSWSTCGAPGRHDQARVEEARPVDEAVTVIRKHRAASSPGTPRHPCRRGDRRGYPGHPRNQVVARYR